MSRLRSISFSQDIVERASNVGLVVPTIRVEELLQQRLARVDRQLTIDEGYLFNGIREIGIEKSLGVNIISTPRYDTSSDEPRLERVRYNHAEVTISPVPRPEYFLRRRMNRAFWSGILLMNAFTEDSDAFIEKKQDDAKDAKALEGKVILSATVIGLITIIGNDITNLEPNLLAFYVSTAVEFASFGLAGAMKFRAKQIEKMPFIKYMDHKNRNAVEDLAISHPVLSYAYNPLASG